MNKKNKIKGARVTLAALVLATGMFAAPATHALFTQPDGGMIALSIPCISSMGPGLWTMKANSAVPVVYLYPSRAMRKNYLPPTTGITTLGLISTFIIDCTTTTIPPMTLAGRLSILYGTAIGL